MDPFDTPNYMNWVEELESLVVDGKTNEVHDYRDKQYYEYGMDENFTTLANRKVMPLKDS